MERQICCQWDRELGNFRLLHMSNINLSWGLCKADFLLFRIAELKFTITLEYVATNNALPLKAPATLLTRFPHFCNGCSSSLTRNSGVVSKRTTAVYAEGGCKSLFKCVAVAKVDQGWLKSKDCGDSLTSSCHPAKYERSRSSCRPTGTEKPKRRSKRFDLFCEGQGHICHLS